jgi:antitoxin MazE
LLLLMLTAIRRIGNSHGVLIPKPLLAQAGLDREVEMTVERDAIVLRKPRPQVRSGWAEASKSIASAGHDKLAWPEFGNLGDDELEW